MQGKAPFAFLRMNRIRRVPNSLSALSTTYMSDDIGKVEGLKLNDDIDDHAGEDDDSDDELAPFTLYVCKIPLYPNVNTMLDAQ